MATKRSDRFGSAVDFARALQRVELELGYAPTNIEVPNLGVARADRDESESGEDETRVRSVATIVAQAPAPATPVRPAPPADDEPTRMRGAVPVIEPTDRTVLRPHRTPKVAPETTTVGSAPDEPTAPVSPRRRGLVIGVVAAAVVLIGGGVAAAVLVPQAAPSPSHSGDVAGPGATNGGITLSVVPDPVAGTVTRSPDGTSVSFVWKNPKPKAGDQYRWRQQDTTKLPVLTTKAEAVVDSLAPGTNVCIEVEIIRGGRTSANPLQECTT
jgi:hypothetical protein